MDSDHHRPPKRLRTLEDILLAVRSERWRQGNGSSSFQIPNIDGLPTGSSALQPCQRKPVTIVDSEDAEGSVSVPEPEPEPYQVKSAHIDDNLISNIISRTPWRSICRFKSVSTHWLDLINSVDFSHRLRMLSKNEPDLLAGMFYQDKREVKFTTFISNTEQLEELRDRGLNALDQKLGFLPNDFFIVGCHHGLLLCSRRAKRYAPIHGFRVDGGEARYYVSNPITEKCRWLPAPPASPSRFLKTGFLVDEESGHHRVIQIPLKGSIFDSVGDEGLIDIRLYSSSNHAWRSQQYMFDCSFEHFRPLRFITIFSPSPFEEQTFAIGKSLYWMDQRHMIVCCDTENENVRVIKPPVCEFEFSGGVSKAYLDEFDGVLRYVLRDSKRFRLWELQEGRWELVNEVLVNSITKSLRTYVKDTRLPFRIEDYKPLALNSFDPNVVFLKVPGMIIAYNFVRNRVEMNKSFEMKHGLLPQTVVPYLLPKIPTPLF